MAFTNEGLELMIRWALRGESPVGGAFKLHLVTNDPATLTPSVTLLGELTEITGGNGYVAGDSGGIDINPNATDFDVISHTDSPGKAITQLKDITWTASGGTIPASGSDARALVLTDANGTANSRKVIAYWDLITAFNLTNGQSVTLSDFELDLRQ